jgi:hypothetical protein
MMEQARHPVGEDPSFECLRIGYFVDWLDSRSEDRGQDGRLLVGLRSENAVVAVAGCLAGRLAWSEIPREFQQPHPHVDHGVAYGVDYHADIVRRLDESELPAAIATYTRLLEVVPGCASALANLAEAAARAGKLAEAERLLLEGAGHALADRERHGVRDMAWCSRLRSALSRFGLAPAERAETVLDWASALEPEALAARLVLLRDADSLGREAYRGATASQREVLGAAVALARLAPVTA